LIDAGQRDFGESRVQEAASKWPELRNRHPDVRLHMIGRLQSNKAAEAVALFHPIQSLHRDSLLDAWSAPATAPGRFPACFVQVNIGEEEQKGGLPVAELGDFLGRVRASPLPLAGLMCIPPAGLEPSPFFAFLNELARRHDVTGLSMGMSADYAEAVMLGATMVRVGSALFAD
jgi:pyridoxal phosphate enzyme (YggS family)